MRYLENVIRSQNRESAKNDEEYSITGLSKKHNENENMITFEKLNEMYNYLIFVWEKKKKLWNPRFFGNWLSETIVTSFSDFDDDAMQNLLFLDCSSFH